MVGQRSIFQFSPLSLTTLFHFLSSRVDVSLLWYFAAALVLLLQIFFCGSSCSFLILIHSMGRFSDEWLIDRTLFDFVQGGSCACCSFTSFLPGGTAGLIQSLSELETDQAKAEVSALDKLPWPTDMRDQVWMERVRLRQKLKPKLKEYAAFWNEHGTSYRQWIHNQSPQRLRQWFQLPRQEVTETLKNDFNIHAAFGSVLCAVVEQVAHFEITGYPADGRGDAELGFETILKFDRRGGFGIFPVTTTSSSSEEDDDRTNKNDTATCKQIIDIWLQRQESLGGPKLLERAVKVVTDDDDSEGDDEGDADEAVQPQQQEDPAASNSEAGPSFRLDRRLIRLVIARYWADVLQKAYLKDTSPAE